MYRLREEDIRVLIKQTEAGMGYQLIHARINDRPLTHYVVFNCELAIELNRLKEVPYASADVLLSKADSVFQFELKKLVSLDDLPPPTGGPGAPPSPLAPTPILKRTTLAYEGFIRVSAFDKDKRVLSDGALAKETYATTVADMKQVPSGFAAVGRYALPNPMAAIYVYVIVPGSGVLIQGGTVRPAYFQSGGGVEVFFPDGAPPGSVFKPYVIPEI